MTIHSDPGLSGSENNGGSRFSIKPYSIEVIDQQSETIPDLTRNLQMLVLKKLTVPAHDPIIHEDSTE